MPQRTLAGLVACALMVAAVPSSAGAEPTEATGAADEIIESVARMESDPLFDPDLRTAELRRIVALAEEHPFAVADRPEAHDARITALLALAVLAQQRGARDEASALIDEVIRVARGDVVPAGSLERMLYDRLALPQNAHHGSLHVACKTPCRVVLDERDIGHGTEVSARGIPYGPHRLSIRALDEAGYTQTSKIELGDGSPRHDVTFEDPAARKAAAAAAAKPAAPIAAPAPPPPAPTPQAPEPAWPMPRWVSIVGISLGAGTLAAGGVLIGLDGRCLDGTDPKLEPRCADVFDTMAPGISLAAAGAAFVIAFSVTLAVGDARTNAAARKNARLTRGAGKPWRWPLRASR